MWNLSFAPPQMIEARVLTRMPPALRRPCRTDWADANRGGKPIDSFIEGPAFDGSGNLYLTDIPNGRILCVDAYLGWSTVTEYDGWPNGIAVHPDASLWIADHRRGLLRLDPGKGALEALLGHRNSESFRGLNDLVFDGEGRCFFTDQGQSGMHDPSGRVFRWDPDAGRLDCLLSNAPSPNGVALANGERALLVAVTRANAVWRGPLLDDGSVSKVGVLQTFFGVSGPDGLAVDAHDRLVVAHASLGGAFVLDSTGAVTHFIRSPMGGIVTNVAFRPGTGTVVLTESASATVLEAQLPPPEGRRAIPDADAT